MAYTIEFSSQFEKSMKKLKKKDKEMFLRIQKKLTDIVKHPNRYKNLKNVLAGYQRIHFGPFVLIFKVDEDTVRIISLDHHDKSY
mgnify:FL=1